jgi:hypothetical protein
MTLDELSTLVIRMEKSTRHQHALQGLAVPFNESLSSGAMAVDSKPSIWDISEIGLIFGVWGPKYSHLTTVGPTLGPAGCERATAHW